MIPVEVKNLRKTFDEGKVVAVDNINLTVEPGELLTLLGPSGCGKTTTLRCIAGLEEIDGGEISFGDTVIASAEKGIHARPEKRGVGMVFQSYAVWPHMTVQNNVAFPLKLKRIPKKEIIEKVLATLQMVGLEGLHNRYPTLLSGGQQQRVALARAIVGNPQVLLFDEPLSNLDAKLREQMRFEIVRLQRELGTTAVYVTHDQAEAMVISDTVIIMNQGEIVQRGNPREIYNLPKNKFVADFIGLSNTLSGRVGSTLDKEKWLAIQTPIGCIKVSCHNISDYSPNSEVSISIRPENIIAYRERPHKGINVFRGTVEEVAFLGEKIDYRIGIAKICLRVQTHPDIVFIEGEEVFLEVLPEKCTILRS